MRLGVGSHDDQRDFYLCDNVIEGRLRWPRVYGDDGGARSDDDGIHISGSGHVVCHNRISGFGDAIKNGQPGARALDIDGNETLSAYDNAVGLDLSEGNARCFRNRFLNSWAPLRYQPVYGGPAYAFRNVAINIADEQNKLKSLGGVQESVGVRIHNNTFVSAGRALQLRSSATVHDTELRNNLFIGPRVIADGRTVEWTAPMDRVALDRNGYFPDGVFNSGGAGRWPGFAAMQAAGRFERGGVLLTQGVFVSGLLGPADYRVALAGADVSLAADAGAIAAGEELPNITDGYTGRAPDLGALERGCPAPIYGPRPEGVDEASGPAGCTPSEVGPDGGAGQGPDPAEPRGASGAAGAAWAAGRAARGCWSLRCSPSCCGPGPATGGPPDGNRARRGHR